MMIELRLGCPSGRKSTKVKENVYAQGPCISLLSITVTKYLWLGNFIKKIDLFGSLFWRLKVKDQAALCAWLLVRA